jgi:cytochrome P450
MNEQADRSGTSRPFPFPAPSLLEFPPQWAEVRNESPVSHVRLPHGAEAWLATGYDEVRRVLVDPRFSRAVAAEHENARLTPARILNSSLIGLDPPDHTRLRKLASHAFTARRVERLRPRVIEIVDSLLDRMADQERPADLLDALTRPLPALVISEMMGVPPSEINTFLTYSGQAIAGPSRPDDAAAGYKGLIEFFGRLVEAKRAAPGDDLTSALIEAGDVHDRLSDDEMVALSVLLLVAGHEAITTVFSMYVVILTAQRPALWQELRANPDMIPAAVEEFLRMVPRTHIGGGFPRIAKEDVELGGVRIKAGETVIPAMDAANRDPKVFPHPEELDFHRSENPHFGFGAGIHFCIGAGLARIEMQEALRLLLERFPSLRVAVPVEELQLTPGTQMRILQALPVTW